MYSSFLFLFVFVLFVFCLVIVCYFGMVFVVLSRLKTSFYLSIFFLLILPITELGPVPVYSSISCPSFQIFPWPWSRLGRICSAIKPSDQHFTNSVSFMSTFEISGRPRDITGNANEQACALVSSSVLLLDWLPRMKTYFLASRSFQVS